MRKATKRGRRGRADSRGDPAAPRGPRRGHAPELAPVARDLRDDLVREVALVAAVARGGAGASARAAPGAFPARPRGAGTGEGSYRKARRGEHARAPTTTGAPDARALGLEARRKPEARTGEGARGPAGARARACRCGRARIDPRARPPRCAFWFAHARDGVAPAPTWKRSPSPRQQNPNQDFAAQSSRPRQKSRRRFAVIQGNQSWSILSLHHAPFSFSSSFWFVSSTLKTPKSPHTLEPLDYGHGPSGCSRAYLSTMLLSVAL